MPPMSPKELLQLSIIRYPAAFFAGFFLMQYLTDTPFYEGYQIAGALRASRLKRLSVKLELPTWDTSNGLAVRITNPSPE
ncbi:hypothetical protein MMC31_001829 [Peltigera leucophlebia]|nr:hypothetical protein [Peltigera leucophlebia]